MKYFYKPIFFLAALLFSWSCNKDVSTQETLYPLLPTSADANAANWTSVYINSYTKYAASVPTPTDTSSAAYKAELASIKNLQSVLTNDQKNNIAYWSDGGVLRWNQTFRELVTRYNLPPEPLANNTYPAPDANNPFASPQFPFANPPYAARAYSYVSAAIYDALKTAWYYKYQYNRPSPYIVDKNVKPLMPQVGIPSYPSEEAVMSSAAQTILLAMFPASSDEIINKAGQQRAAALLSGKASASDISAGIALGKAVAQDYLTRAGSDGTGAAGGTAPQWAAFQDTATKRGQIPWLSLDGPPRPPMLPLFGYVKAWMMTPNDIVSVRAPTPPASNSDEMKEEVEKVKYQSDHLTREHEAIVLRWADGANTYTPPGHWNDIAEEYIRDKKWSEVRTARAFALLNMTMHDASVACWNTKYYYFNARPTQVDPSIKTGTGIPNFPSYVSGHSSYSFAAASVLSYLFPEHQDYFVDQASEAMNSRFYAGIHYQIDCTAGADLGKNVGAFTVNFAQNDGAD